MNIVEFIKRCHRVLLISRKPTRDEFMKVAKVSGIGLLIFGTIGLIITILFNMLNAVKL